MIYTAEQAKKYRECDEAPDATAIHFGKEIEALCDGLERPSLVLDFGCGTGRYFHRVSKRHDLTGLDPSPFMLAEAENPAGGRRAERLVLGAIDCDLSGTKYELIYSIGVLAEHIPLLISILDTVHGWLTVGGKFYFTAEEIKENKPETIGIIDLARKLEDSKFSESNVSTWKTDNPHFKGTHFEVTAHE